MRNQFAYAAISLFLLAGCSQTPAVRDTQPPTLTTASPAEVVTNQATITITGTATDDKGIAKLQYTVNGGTPVDVTSSLKGNTFSFTVPVSEGVNTIVVTAQDAAGNKSPIATQKVTRDSKAPTLTIDHPTANLQTLATSVTVSGTAGGHLALKTLTYSVNGGAAQPLTVSNGAYSFSVSLQPGVNTIAVTAENVAGNVATASVSVERATGTASVQGIVVDQNAGAPVAGSRIELSGVASGSLVTTTDASGRYSFGDLPDGTYTVTARKAGYAGSDVHGLPVSGAVADVRLIQRPAFDTSATQTPAKLVITREDDSEIRGSSFTNTIKFRIKSAADSQHVGPLRTVLAALGRTPGSASVQGTATALASVYSYTPPADATTPMDTGVAAPAATFTSGYGSATGENVYMEVAAYDFNYNYVRYILPITLVNTSATASNTVVAPTLAAATAYTMKQEGSWTTPNAADPNSMTFVDVRWCYTNTTTGALPLAFDIERSSDAVNFVKIGTVGGAANASCSATNPTARPFFYRDNSASLEVGTKYTYRVIARGANVMPSNATSTTPLAPFFPTLLKPADESNTAPLQPTFEWSHPQKAIGADGAAYNLRLRDLMTLGGYNLPGNAANAGYRVEFGTGATGNGVNEDNAIVYTATVNHTGARPALTASNVLTDMTGQFVPVTKLAPVNAAEGTASLPLASLNITLQSQRPYRWELYSAYAYKYSPDEGGRVSAISVYSWPIESNAVPAPMPTVRPVTQSFDFTTGQ